MARRIRLTETLREKYHRLGLEYGGELIDTYMKSGYCKDENGEPLIPLETMASLLDIGATLAAAVAVYRHGVDC